MKAHLAFFFLFIFNSITLFSQAIPPITNFSPSDYGADNQNWDITQSDYGKIYAANNRGLISYNGEQWQVHPSPNQTIIRSVFTYDEYIYTGAHMDFGVWTEDDKGQLSYLSIVDKFNIKMLEGEEVWEIITFQDKIIFQSLRRLFVFDSNQNEVNIIDISKEPLDFRLFKLENLLVYQVIGKGVFILKDGLPILYNDSKILKSKRLINIFIEANKWIGVTRNEGIYEIVGNDVELWNKQPINELKGASIYSAIRLKDKSIAIGTISKGLLVINSNGVLEYSINKNNGLHNNTVLSLFQDRDSNLWLGLDNGMSIINTSSQLRVYSDPLGSLGTIYTSISHNDNFYIGTNQGLFFKKKQSSTFILVPGTSEQVWALRVINGELFCGHNKGTFLVNNGNAQLIGSKNGTWDIMEVPNFPSLLIQGNYDGLHILEKNEGNWKIRNKISGFESSSKHFAFSKTNKILVNNEYKGVYEIHLDNTLKRATSVNLNTSVSKGEHSSIQKFDGSIYFASQDGLFKYNDETSTFIKNDRITAYFHDEYLSGKLINDQNGSLWMFTKNKILQFTNSPLNDKLTVREFYIPVDFRNMNKGYENLSNIANFGYLLGTSDGYLQFQPRSTTQNRRVSINSIHLKELDGNLIPLSTKASIKLETEQNSLVFTYSTLSFQKFSKPQYQHRLLGFYDEWSKWSYNSSVEYANITPGEYKFEVRSKGGNTLSSKIASYDFTIDKPWYKSNLAITIYIIAVLGLVGTIQWLANRYFDRKRNNDLELERREITLKAINVEKENVKLRNANLENEIKARNRELATITMGAVDRNNILNSIKDSLNEIKLTEGIDPVIKEIDDILRKGQDWNEFEKAFNRADKDFFNNVKEKHPNLTSNDFKLCVYLRLNMTSKEIAPLLNISYRSVEIKRYRLRKKLNLEHSVNLNEYFMQL